MAKKVIRPSKKSPRAQGPSVKWTVMVYMAAAKDDLQTERAAIRDLRELERVGSTDEVHVVVQLDRIWPGTPERYLIRKGVSERVHVTPPNRNAATRETRRTMRDTMRDRKSSGSPEALSQFLDWSRNNHSAERYLLVLWGHAYGLGFGRDHGDPLTLRELSSTLETFGKRGRLDLLGANACAMSYAEAAYELQDAAEYLVASEITMPFSGWPYAAILQRLNERVVGRPNAGAKEVGGIIIDEFLRSFRRKGVALSLLQLSRASMLKTHLKDLADAIKAALVRPELSDGVVDAFLDSAHGDVRPLIDLYDLCANLERLNVGSIVQPARKLRSRLESGSGRLISRHAADDDFEGLHGLGIFAPSITSGADLQRLELRPDEYEGLALMQDTGNAWTDLAYGSLADLLEPLNAEIDDLVMRAGASSRDERASVGQLLLSAKRSFDRLEDAVRDAKEAVTSAVGGASASRRRIGSPVTERPLFLRLMADDAADARGGNRRVGNQPVLRTGPLREAVTSPLRAIEIALTATERMLRRILTNGSVGLGADGSIKPGLGQDVVPTKLGFGPGDGVKPGFGDVDGVKPGFGDVDGVKPGFGDVDGVKPGFGDVDGVKPGFGAALMFTSDGAVLTGDMVSVTQLFSAVASSMRALEEGLGRLERRVLTPVPGGRTRRENRLHAIEEVGRGFRALEDRISVARQTAFWVFRHPVHGLGPTAGDSGSASRRHIAAVGGLSPDYLRLL